MISYKNFWKTLSRSGITQYSLINDYDVSSSLLDRLRKGRHVSTRTLDMLCRILGCRIEDIVEYVDDSRSL